MALLINDNCTACDACKPVCPNEAISVADPIYIIDAFRCTECVGAEDEPQCKLVCPADCIVPNPDFAETPEAIDGEVRVIARVIWPMAELAANRSIEYFDEQFARQIRDHDFQLNPFEQLALPHLRGRCSTSAAAWAIWPSLRRGAVVRCLRWTRAPPRSNTFAKWQPGRAWTSTPRKPICATTRSAKTSTASSRSAC